MKNTIVISAFPGVGKTTFFNSYKDFYEISDSDSSDFRNANFPENYFEHIKSKIGKVDFLLVSSHESIRQRLEDEGIKYLLFFPFVFQKDEWFSRFYKRNDSDSFIAAIDNNWNKWIKSCRNQRGCISIPVSAERYLSDFIQLPF